MLLSSWLQANFAAVLNGQKERGPLAVEGGGAYLCLFLVSALLLGELEKARDEKKRLAPSFARLWMKKAAVNASDCKKRSILVRGFPLFQIAFKCERPVNLVVFFSIRCSGFEPSTLQNGEEWTLYKGSVILL